MANFDFQWKASAGGTFADIPVDAYGGTHTGTLEVRYPKTTDFDGLGIPCGAIGPVDIIIRSTAMKLGGFDWWQNRFSATASEYVQIWIKALNPRTAGWDSWTGYLLRPEFGDVVVMKTTDTTYFKDVQITIANCETYTP